MFLDEAIIMAQGGKGGNGALSWRREKYVPKGGPDGGDGGKGGSVVLIANENTDTLSDFVSRKKFEAQNGNNGGGNNRGGKDGEDTLLNVPTGTVVSALNEKGEYETVADLRETGDRVIIAYGGRGGFGNAHFTSSVRQRPDFAELGEPGEERQIKLDLKLVADVGIVGYPSVGKSTLISVISNARPKIAAYPFTTLIPNLGVVRVHDRSFVVCDVPGLIEGASEGKGLGDKFLRHIERTGTIVHMLDIGRALVEGGSVDVEALIRDYKAIRKELEAYSPVLSHKREIIVLNKADLVGNDTSSLEKQLSEAGIEIFASISAATKGNVQMFLDRLLPVLLEERDVRKKQEEDTVESLQEMLPVIRPQEDSARMGAYRLENIADGSIRIRGKRLEQFTKMTNFSSHGGLDRFRNVVERIGLLKALKQHGQKEDTLVYIGDVDVTAFL